MSSDEQSLITLIENKEGLGLGVTSSPSSALDIVIDITQISEDDRVLGQMVYVMLEEGGAKILAIGQVVEVTTHNRWHEYSSFKGVIKHHGGLPHLSGRADNRIAKVSVQACYRLQDGGMPVEHTLANSPSTGRPVRKMDGEVMAELMLKHQHAILHIGRVYGTDVDLPFWFKHFGKTSDDEVGAKDAYHIGVFGKTGSGKTVTASMMLLGYAKNKKNMSILVLDPQGQFYQDKDLLPSDEKLSEQVASNGQGMHYEALNILENVYLPNDNKLLGQLLISSRFIRDAFRVTTPDKIEDVVDSIDRYLSGLKGGFFNLDSVDNPKDLLKSMLNRFVENKEKYINSVYRKTGDQDRLERRISYLRSHLDSEPSIVSRWEATLALFSKQDNKWSIDQIVSKVVREEGNFIVLDLQVKNQSVINENLPAVFIKIIEQEIVKAGSERYEGQGDNANCLIVMDEAHRFISDGSKDEWIRELTKEIINSVRTTRKYGIGYMFITQTIESLDEEILRQMRIYAFGYGLTSGSEARKVGEIIHNPHALNLYKSFIDPSSGNRYPFMFFGPISPLSFTGSPLFLEVYNEFGDYIKKNQNTDNSEQS